MNVSKPRIRGQLSSRDVDRVRAVVSLSSAAGSCPGELIQRPDSRRACLSGRLNTEVRAQWPSITPVKVPVQVTSRVS